MTVKTLIQEAINKNVLGFEQALKEELRNRVGLALEAKMAAKSVQTVNAAFSASHLAAVEERD